MGDWATLFFVISGVCFWSTLAAVAFVALLMFIGDWAMDKIVRAAEIAVWFDYLTSDQNQRINEHIAAAREEGERKGREAGLIQAANWLETNKEHIDASARSVAAHAIRSLAAKEKADT